MRVLVQLLRSSARETSTKTSEWTGGTASGKSGDNTRVQRIRIIYQYPFGCYLVQITYYSLIECQAVISTLWATQLLGPPSAPVEPFSAKLESTWDTKIFQVTKGHITDTLHGSGYHNIEGMSPVAIAIMGFNPVKVPWLLWEKRLGALGTRQLHPQRFWVACQNSDIYCTYTLL